MVSAISVFLLLSLSIRIESAFGGDWPLDPAMVEARVELEATYSYQQSAIGKRGVTGMIHANREQKKLHDFVSGDTVCSASFHLSNDVSGVISVECHNDAENLGYHDMTPSREFAHTFTYKPNEIWVCDFEWDTEGGRYLQSIQAWQHVNRGAGNLVWRCFDCKWSVREDGFYVEADGVYYHQYYWA